MGINCTCLGFNGYGCMVSIFGSLSTIWQSRRLHNMIEHLFAPLLKFCGAYGSFGNPQTESDLPSLFAKSKARGVSNLLEQPLTPTWILERSWRQADDDCFHLGWVMKVPLKSHMSERRYILSMHWDEHSWTCKTSFETCMSR